ncbi:hypothetical protein C0Q70_20801 [Pomacea canaliculata]|uniref:Uncharacterized protein n=1 Tax=Pomacea canaliculata TaxID=400727 RepID=A0A2T7NAU1_POMCA|nr:hypothetical protein C0Q70_20801 [Pomacea canaliculata]
MLRLLVLQTQVTRADSRSRKLFRTLVQQGREFTRRRDDDDGAGWTLDTMTDSNANKGCEDTVTRRKSEKQQQVEE